MNKMFAICEQWSLIGDLTIMVKGISPGSYPPSEIVFMKEYALPKSKSVSQKTKLVFHKLSLFL